MGARSGMGDADSGLAAKAGGGDIGREAGGPHAPYKIDCVCHDGRNRLHRGVGVVHGMGAEPPPSPQHAVGGDASLV